MSFTNLDNAARSVCPEVIELIEGIAEWAVTLQGQTPMLKGLGRLREAFGAEAIALTRVGCSPGSGSHVLTVDGRSGQPNVSLVDRSYAKGLLGPYLLKPREASTWFTGVSASDEEYPALQQFQRRRGFAEFVVIVLEVEEKAVYFLELHFQHRLRAQTHGIVNELAGILSSMWKQRSTGRFSEALIKGSVAPVAEQMRKGRPVDMLTASNPAQLSRAEFRVCSLLARGLSTTRLRQELDISASTLRSHLRSVYHKTGTSNLADLVYNLLAPPVGKFEAPGATQYRDVS